MAINAMHLPVGARLRLKDGSLVEVTGNPRDGMWLHVRALPGGKPVEELCFVEEIAEVLPQGQG